jgi:hypothetical protein
MGDGWKFCIMSQHGSKRSSSIRIRYQVLLSTELSLSKTFLFWAQCSDLCADGSGCWGNLNAINILNVLNILTLKWRQYLKSFEIQGYFEYLSNQCFEQLKCDENLK